MDSTRIAHITTELVLMGSMFLYLKGQISSIRAELNEMKANIETNNNTVKTHIGALYESVDKISKIPALQPQFIGELMKSSVNQSTPNPIPFKRGMQLRSKYNDTGIRQRKPAKANDDDEPASRSSKQVKIAPVSSMGNEDDPAEDSLDEDLRDELDKLEESNIESELKEEEDTKKK